jgi:hypothetical protein
MKKITTIYIYICRYITNIGSKYSSEYYERKHNIIDALIDYRFGKLSMCDVVDIVDNNKIFGKHYVPISAYDEYIDSTVLSIKLSEFNSTYKSYLYKIFSEMMSIIEDTIFFKYYHTLTD